MQWHQRFNGGLVTQR